MKPEHEMNEGDIEVLNVPDLVAACFIAEKIIEKNQHTLEVFLIDIDGTITTGELAYLMKFPLVSYIIPENIVNIVPQKNIEALQSLLSKNQNIGVAIITNRIRKSRTWQSAKLIENVEENISNMHIPIFFNTNRLVPEAILQSKFVQKFFGTNTRIIEILSWLNEILDSNTDVCVNIISDKSFPEAPTEKIFLKELLTRIPNSKGRIIQIS